eukprot:12447172-Ditylum_brightwellii.AAC.1
MILEQNNDIEVPNIPEQPKRCGKKGDNKQKQSSYELCTSAYTRVQNDKGHKSGHANNTPFIDSGEVHQE